MRVLITHTDFFHISHYPEVASDTRTHVVANGLALDVDRVRVDFTSYDDIARQAYKPPCEVCSTIFVNGRITQQDIGSGRISGPFPSDMRMDPGFAARVSMIIYFLICI